MKKNCIAVDIGNTSLHFGRFEEDRLVQERKLAVGKLENFFSWWKQEFQEFLPQWIALASVNPKITENFISKITSLFQRASIFKVGEDHPVPIPMDVKAPKEVGVDRLVNGWWAQKKYGTPVLVVDFGTAITIDVVSPKGVYLGGIIAPGLRLSAKGLYEGTALLPEIQVVRKPCIIGKNTIEAMESGIFWGAVGMVEIWVQKVMAFQQWENCQIIATGGDAALIASECSSISQIDPFLTLEGIYQLGKLYFHSNSH